MIDQTANFAAAAPCRPDAAYQSWQGSMNKTVMRHDPEARTAAPMPCFGSMVHETALAAQNHNAYAPGPALGPDGKTPDISYGPANGNDDGFSFGDVIDMINPLQHLPVIGALYRKFTGDTIKPMSNIIGGAIFGGPIGAVSSTVNVVVKSTTGKDIAENAFAMAGFDITPEGAKKPDLIYKNESAKNITLASHAANVYADADMVLSSASTKNFASTKFSTQSWNA